ncbi:MAG TPA: Nramp family divalent metal transporter [Anaerolineales bacterium]|nr:Nramp family divalent metal transporter [Anaerolineales bacterium]
MSQNHTPQGLEPVEKLDLSGLPSRPRSLQGSLRLNIRGRSVTLRRFRRAPGGLLKWLLILGPGLIASSAGNDAGGIATYSQAGAKFGYDLIWVMVIIIVSLAVVQEMGARLGAATGRGLLDLIRERFGIGWALLAMGILFVANSGIVVSEFLGIGAAAELFGISKWLSVPVSAILLWYLIIFGSYAWVEKIFLGMTLVFFAYPVAAILARPDWGDVARGAFIPTFRADQGYLFLLVALLGTTITPFMQLFQQSSTVERGVARRHYGPERLDAYAGAIFSNLISITMIIATAATLFQAGPTEIASAADAARALEPFAGNAAKILFAVGLIGASMLAGAVLPLATAYAVSEVFGAPKGVNLDFRRAPIFFGLFTGMIFFGALVSLIPNLPVIQWLVAVSVLNGVLLPIMLIFILRLINDERLMGSLKNSRVYNILGWGTFILITTAVLVMLGSQILTTLGIIPK